MIKKRVLFEMHENIGSLIINDPPANKMTNEFMLDFCEVMRNEVCRAKVKGILIYGNGRHYSSGADLRQLRTSIASHKISGNNGVEMIPILYQQIKTSFVYLRNLSIPVVSAISGLCYGSGLELAMCSHIRVSAENAMMCLPEITFGVLPGACGTVTMPMIVGLGKALELILKGEVLTGTEALGIGLVDVVTNKNECLEEAKEILKYFVENVKSYSKECVRDYLVNYRTFKKLKMAISVENEKQYV